MKIIVLTGAPGLGKHELVNEVFSTISSDANRFGNVQRTIEAMTAYLASLPAGTPIPDFAEMPEKDRDSIRRWVFDYYVSKVKAVPDGHVLVTDRFIHEAAAYAEIEGRQVPDYIQKHLDDANYDVEVLTVPFNPKTGIENEKLHNSILKSYLSKGCTIREIDGNDLTTRTSNVLDMLREACA